MTRCGHVECREDAQPPSAFCRVHRHPEGSGARAWAEVEQAFLQAVLPPMNRFLGWLSRRLAR